MLGCSGSGREKGTARQRLMGPRRGRGRMKSSKDGPGRAIELPVYSVPCLDLGDTSECWNAALFSW